MTHGGRERIVQAALELFSQQGFDGIGLRDIAVRAGVTHGLVRHHFGSKDGLWEAVVAAADATYGAALAPALATARTDSDPASAVAAVVAALARVAAEQPHFVRLLIHESFTGGPRLRRILDSLAPLADAVTVLLERLHADGRLPQFDPTSFLLFLVLTSSGPAALAGLTAYLATGRQDPTPTAEVVIRTLFPDRTGAVVGR